MAKEMNSIYTKKYVPEGMQQEYPVSVCFTDFSFTTENTHWHWHDEIELLIVNSGSLRVQTETDLLDLSAGQGIIINQKYDVLAKRLSVKYNKLWLGAEIFLFVLVGIAVDLKYALAAGVVVILLVILALVFRMMGVAVSLVKTKLNKKERLFCMVAYTPKATVQAALGTVPLAMGLSCGEIVLTVAVISILITAPFGAICVDNSYKKLLSK